MKIAKEKIDGSRIVSQKRPNYKHVFKLDDRPIGVA